MNDEKISKPFIPRNKPKSWVIAILGGLIGLGGGLIGFIGAGMKIAPLYFIGKVIFFVCWVIMFPNMLFFIFRHVAGSYKNLEEKNWKDQIW